VPTRRVLAQARAAQIACVCLTIGLSISRETLASTFGGACHLALPQLQVSKRALFERAVTEVGQSAPSCAWRFDAGDEVLRRQRAWGDACSFLCGTCFSHRSRSGRCEVPR
jgi:hypothetical protein